MANPSYTLANYGEMIADEIRMAAYDAAIRAACRPGSRVLDLGCGPGLFSLLACRYGAAKVYALDPSPVIAVAREIAAANGLADRITFIQQMSMRVTLPEPIDLLITDLRGVLPMTGTSLAAMKDARRFLAADGVTLPVRDLVRVALAEAPSTLTHIVTPWRAHAGFDLRAAEQLLLHTFKKVHLPAEAMLTAPSTLFTLDYRTIEEISPSGRVRVPVLRDGTAHGICIWFDAVLHGSTGFSNEPGQPAELYGQAFFPLTAPVSVVAGDTLSLTFRASQIDDHYILMWDTTIERVSGHVAYRAQQSTFHASPLSIDILRRTDASAHPSLTLEGEIDRFVLDRIDGKTSAATVAARLAERFPERFATAAAALTHVLTLTNRYRDD